MTDSVTQAMILAAGKGLRLKPFTLETPKVLLPVGGVPLICHTLTWLKRYGISRVTINLHYLGNKIRNFLGDGSRFGVEISYSYEENLLGTAGGVKKMERFFNDTFLVVYGDILTNIDLSNIVGFHRKKKAMITLVLSEITNPYEVGIVQLNKRNRVIDFVEKPPGGTYYGNLANGGIYVMERGILDYVPNHGFYDFAYDIFPKLIQRHLPIYGYSINPQAYLVDIGTYEKYQLVNRNINNGTLRINYG
jgi:NDP-sugar pyrophosphorylase family protein